MRLKFDYNNMMTDVIGAKEGISAKDIADNSDKAIAAWKKVIDNRGKGWQEWTELPFNQGEIVADILTTAKKYSGYDNLVVFGIGGSALGPLAVASPLLHMRHNELSAEKRGAPKLYVEDNVDPERMNALLDVIDIKKTVFNVITKSGTTSETLTQFLVIYERLKKELGAKAKENIVVTTTIGKGTLYNIAKAEGFKIFGLGEGVGGRFSVLSPVGLVPLAICGVDIKGLLEGAKAMSEASFKGEVTANPALLTALLQCLSMARGKNISVMMPYADGLKYMADFYCQLWGESLGKAVDNDGRTVNAGQTPAKSLGVTDQHSQIQLYTEGPYDKVVTFLAVEEYANDVTIPAAISDGAVDFLCGRKMSELINFERKATEFALAKAQRANFTITFDKVDAHTVGELLMYYMYQTAFAGAMLNIDTYNQPGVEEGKLATFAMMGRKGYESKMEEINSLKKSDKFVI